MWASRREAAAHAALRLRSAAILEALAARLAAECGLSRKLAKRRVMQLSISAAPRPKCGGFGDRE
jgi:hypothetical protein